MPAVRNRNVILLSHTDHIGYSNSEVSWVGKMEGASVLCTFLVEVVELLLFLCERGTKWRGVLVKSLTERVSTPAPPLFLLRYGYSYNLLPMQCVSAFIMAPMSNIPPNSSKPLILELSNVPSCGVGCHLSWGLRSWDFYTGHGLVWLVAVLIEILSAMWAACMAER